MTTYELTRTDYDGTPNPLERLTEATTGLAAMVEEYTTNAASGVVNIVLAAQNLYTGMWAMGKNNDGRGSPQYDDDLDDSDEPRTPPSRWKSPRRHRKKQVGPRQGGRRSPKGPVRERRR